jgi:hypothetical protein
VNSNYAVKNTSVLLNNLQRAIPTQINGLVFFNDLYC